MAILDHKFANKKWQLFVEFADLNEKVESHEDWSDLEPLLVDMRDEDENLVMKYMRGFGAEAPVNLAKEIARLEKKPMEELFPCVSIPKSRAAETINDCSNAVTKIPCVLDHMNYLDDFVKVTTGFYFSEGKKYHRLTCHGCQEAPPESVTERKPWYVCRTLYHRVQDDDEERECDKSLCPGCFLGQSTRRKRRTVTSNHSNQDQKAETKLSTPKKPKRK